MKRVLISILALATIGAASASAQYKSVSYDTQSPVKIVQIDEGEFSNIVFFTATATKDESYLDYNDETAYVAVQGEYKKYKPKAIAGIGIESDNVQSMIRKAGDQFNFAVEFEKFPLDGTFSIFENEENANAFNFSNVKVDKSVKGSKIPVEDFLDYATAPRTGLYYEEGSSLRYWSEKGLVMTAHFVTSNEYGKLFKIYLEIANDTGRSIDFITDNISVTAELRSGRTLDVPLLSYNDFDRKVVNNLGWYSSSTPQSRLSDSFRWMANDKSRQGDTGAAAAFGAISLLAAVSNSQNEVNFQRALENERESVTSCYLLSNTLKDGVVYGGFVAVKDRNDIVKYNVTVKVGKKEFKWQCNK